MSLIETLMFIDFRSRAKALKNIESNEFMGVSRLVFTAFFDQGVHAACNASGNELNKVSLLMPCQFLRQYLIEFLHCNADFDQLRSASQPF